MLSDLVFAIFGGVIGYSICTRKRTDNPDERTFAFWVALVVSVVLVGVSWKISAAKESNRLGLLDRVQEDAHEAAYEDGWQAGWEEAYDEVAHRAERWAEDHLNSSAAQDLAEYLE